jgi:hypothetical protein
MVEALQRGFTNRQGSRDSRGGGESHGCLGFKKTCD